MIAIITACGHNFNSIQNALNRLGVSSVLTAEATVIQKADKIILPGVGTAHAAMQRLQALNLVRVIQTLQQPVLGICLGMQLLYEYSAEGNVPCLGIIRQSVQPLSPRCNLQTPHMGWNVLQLRDNFDPLWTGLPKESYVYFVHSFAAPLSQETIAKTDYGIAFTSAVRHRNYTGMQFHPERSGQVGAQLLKNFIQYG